MDNKSLIIENTLNLFSKKGYEGTGIQEICDISNITKPTLYYYFKSKRGLLQAIVDYYFEILNSRIKTAAIYEGDFVNTLEKITRVYFSFAKEYSVFYKTHISMIFGPSESEPVSAVSEGIKLQYGYIFELFEKAVIQHGNMRGKERMLGALFIGMINTHISLYYFEQLELDDNMVYNAVKRYMHGIMS